MNGFDAARMVEAEGMVRLRPYLREMSHEGRFVLTSKGTLSKRLQESVGDVLLADGPDTCWSVEIKTEREYTGNLFIETWSNRNLADRKSHAERGSNVGWIYKMVADRLFCFFLDTGHLIDIDLFSLQQWAFCKQRLWAFREAGQGRYRQKNDTYGRLVPIATLRAELPPRAVRECVLDAVEKAA